MDEKKQFNVIVLICDGLTYDMVRDRPGHTSPMTFVKSLKNRSLWCTEAYSQGPYTEAGLKGIVYGKSPLEGGAYYVEHIGWEDSIFKAFRTAGYDLFTQYYASCLPPEVLKEGAYSYATKYGNPMYSRYLRSKLDYYRPIWKNGQITKEDYIVIKRLLQRHFDSIFALYSSDYDKNDFTGQYTPFNTGDEACLKRISSGVEHFKIEKERFLSCAEDYIDSIFENYDTCFLLNGANWNAAPYKEEIRAQKQWLTDNYAALFKKIEKENVKLHLKNNIPDRENIRNHFKLCLHKKTMKRGLEFFAREIQFLVQHQKSEALQSDLQQMASSAGTLIDQFIQWHEQRESERPYFSYFHFNEFHRPALFITHETDDYNRLTKDLKDAEQMLENLPADYKGDFRFDLAAQYLDHCIERIFDFLQEKNELDNTIIVITSDHGSSNCGETARFTSVNHFFKEQYHTPLIVYGYTHEILDDFIQSYDIPVTLAKICGIKPHKSWKGSPIGVKRRSYASVEYTGTGVSDIRRRPVLFGYRDKDRSYVVSGMVSKNPNIDQMGIHEYYNLQKDPLEIHNLVNTLSEQQKKECKAFFCNRLRELYDDYDEYLSSIR